MMFGDGYAVWRWSCCLEMVMLFGDDVWRWLCCLEMVMLFGDGHAV